jgi:mannose-6-phosphate isomerase class I
MKMRQSNYDKYPSIKIEGKDIWVEWKTIINQIRKNLKEDRKQILVVETYTGVFHNELIEKFKEIPHSQFIDTRTVFKTEDEIEKMTYPDITDNRIFGYMTRFNISDFFDDELVEAAKEKINNSEKLTIVYGTGASELVENFDLLVYADMARWEIQLRMRDNAVHGLWYPDKKTDFTNQQKRAYFVDWRVCDKIKRKLFNQMDYVLDTNSHENPKLIEASTMFEALDKASKSPFRVKPYFDEGPWGGQWMKEVCDLDKQKENFAWCFDCVPEENSLLINVNNNLVEIPSINLVFVQTTNLLGEAVESRFGKEFPIRFDFLDTMDGGNLSFQVHPTTQYIQETFGMHYTQDESYYILDAEDDASVFLGLKTGIKPEEMIEDLERAQDGEEDFDADKYVNKWPAKKHDHFLIPNGTCHCSGKNSMVLEISSTPYIFTFKMWDWGRLGMDGKPRPINIKHAKHVINWERDTEFTEKELVNQFIPIAEGDGWREEKTGLHKNEFIETRRHWFTKPVLHKTESSVNVFNLVEGREAIVESPNNEFEPFVVHYAETFIIPEAVKEYTIRPYGESEGKEIATIKAFVRV